MVSFDSNPLDKDTKNSKEDNDIALEEAILKPIATYIDEDEHPDDQDQWMACYLPTAEGLEKFKRLREDDEYEPDYSQVYKLIGLRRKVSQRF